MRYDFDDHAEIRMLERGITLAQIDAVMQSPEQIVPGNHGREIYQSRYTNRNGKEMLLRVVVVSTSYPLLIVSAYRTDQVEKYWRKEH